MAKTIVDGSHKDLDAALTTIIAGGTPNVQVVVQARKGYWAALAATIALYLLTTF